MRRIAAAVVAAVLLGGSTVAVAQWGWRRMPPRYPSAEPTHRLFTFARVLYQSTHRERGGQGWHTDYPDADINFSIRLSELTHAPVGVDRRNEPDHIVVRLTDPALFDYPFLFMSDVGTLWLNAEEAARLGAYCGRAASCGSTTSGGRTPGSSGRPRSARSCRPVSTPSSTFRSPIRFTTGCSTSTRCRRCPRFSTSGESGG